MNINATMFVQAINFFVCYLILRFLFLRRAVDIIDQEHKEHDALLNSIESINQKVALQEQFKQQQWLECKSFFKAHTPDVANLDRFVFKRISPPTEYQQLSENELKKMSKHASELLLKKIGAFHDIA